MGAAVSEKNPHPLRCRAGRGRPSLRHARRHHAGAGEHPPRPGLELHRAGHRWRQRLCRARRLRAHHPGRAGNHPDRGRTGRRARARDRSTSPRSTPSSRSRRARRCRWAPPRRSPAAPRCSSAPSPPLTNIVEKGFGREEENECDEKGIALANRVGYAPDGLSGFLTRLKERNKESTEKRGLFASHPEMKERLDDERRSAAEKMASTAIPAIAIQVHRLHADAGDRNRDRHAGSAGLAGSDTKADEKPAEKPEEKKARSQRRRAGFGLSRMLPTGRRREAAGAGDGIRFGPRGGPGRRVRRDQSEAGAREARGRRHRRLQEGRRPELSGAAAWSTP